MTTRLARGSLPWPAQIADRPACQGSLTVETAIAPGARRRITAWPRSAPDGTWWLSIELEPCPAGGRKPTTDKQTSR
jgi:hypothetical protein